jgi:Putative DNA-binding domain/Restriction endonuclease BglII
VLIAIDLKTYLAEDDRPSPYRLVSPGELQRDLKRAFAQLGWNTSVRMPIGRSSRRFREIDFVKEGVGVEITFAKSAFVESGIFFKFPLFIQIGQIHVAVILVPMESMLPGVGSFKLLRDQLTDLSPLPLKYPFAILGVSDSASEIEDVQELTSEMDKYLIEEAGFSLDEMRILTEKPQYDFKERLPESRRLSHLVCAFANLEGGGVILIGVNNDGDILGIPRGTPLDEMQLAIVNAIQHTCRPRPRFETQVFDAPSDPSRCVLVVRVHEMEYKPCMVDEKVYVRVGSSTRAAGPDEIRRLLLK